MTDTTEPALLRCPWCRTAEYVGVVEESPTGPWWAGCGACAMQGPVSAESPEDAARLWNTRAAPEGPTVWISRDTSWRSAVYLWRSEPRRDEDGDWDVASEMPLSIGDNVLARGVHLAPGECAAFRLVRVE